MPRRDHSGPNGLGPMTGKRMGNCGAGRNASNIFGRRHLHGYRANTNKESLIEEKQILEERLENINNALNKE